MYRVLGWPSEAEDFLKLLASGTLLNCPITADDAKRASTIYGPDVASLKGKTTRDGAASRVPVLPRFHCLPTFRNTSYQRVFLCVDFVFVQGQPFMHTISCDLMFRTIQHVGDRKHGTILKELRKVIQLLYIHRGFKVCDIHADHEFECVRADIPIHFEIVAADSHVGEIERASHQGARPRLHPRLAFPAPRPQAALGVHAGPRDPLSQHVPGSQRCLRHHQPAVTCCRRSTP